MTQPKAFRAMSIVMAVLVALSALIGCAGQRPVGGLVSKADTVQSDKPRLAAPDISDTDLAELVAGDSAFAFDVYRALWTNKSNLFYSPYSISAALAMTYAGARNETERQMAEALHLTLGQQSLHPAFNALDLELASRGEGAEGKDEGGFRLNIANTIWGQAGFAFLQQFLDVLAENYGAGLRILDFKTAPDDSRIVINDWVADKTEGKIKDLLPPNSIDALTRLVLTNAIYFNAAWLNPFQEERTRDATFYLLDGSHVTVPMMEQVESFGYAEGEGYRAVELPYSGGELSMVILLPDADQFEGFATTLDVEQVTSVLEGIHSAQVHLTMPKFTFESQFSLAETLAKLGMAQAFTSAADFSGMTGKRDLFIDDVIHKAFVAVDEEGTEAAAATAVIMKLSAAPAVPIKVTIDHPFVFVIRDIQTGAMLFVGHVVNPQT